MQSYNHDVKLSNNKRDFWTPHDSHHKRQGRKVKEDFDQY